jgi:hypothetical protein
MQHTTIMEYLQTLDKTVRLRCITFAVLYSVSRLL